MKNETELSAENIRNRIHYFIQETDIRLLVFTPPVIGFVGLLIGFFMMNRFTNGSPSRPVTFILLGIVSALICFSGYAEIYKKEMPGPFGGIYKGNLAVISGMFTIVLFGLLGASALFYGISAIVR